MRNWNRNKIRELIKEKEVASLPMRNWNACFFFFLFSFLFLLRAYLWGIETEKTRKTKLKPKTVASLPMRNWNEDAISGKVPFFHVASLPMRNWNHLPPLVFVFFFSCCEPTYEELKQEEREKERKKYLGCEPTYEELKQFSIIKNSKRIPKLRAYLWGIETRLLFFSLFLYKPLRAYLWGIETKKDLQLKI